MPMADLQAIKREIEALAPHQQLHFAAGLLEQAAREGDGKRKLMLLKTAHVLAQRVAAELGAALALHELKAGSDG